jgi:hypothetical protein
MIAARDGEQTEHTLLRQPIDVRRPVKLAAVAPQIARTHVVDEHKEDIRFRGGSARECHNEE